MIITRILSYFTFILGPEYSDYLESLNKQKPRDKYDNSKETMKTILTEFHKNCRLRLENLKAKHRRELRLLTRLKQEQADKGGTEALNGNVHKNNFAFPFRRSIVRHHQNGVVPWWKVLSQVTWWNWFSPKAIWFLQLLWNCIARSLSWNVFMVTLSFDNSIYVEILLSLGVKIASSNNIQCIRIKWEWKGSWLS